MSQYFQNLEEKTKQYFHILSEEIPDFLYDYVETSQGINPHHGLHG